MLVSRRIANDVMTYVFPNGKTVCTILNVFILYTKTQKFLTYDSSQYNSSNSIMKKVNAELLQKTYVECTFL